MTSVFRWTPRWLHLSPYQENQNKKRKAIYRENKILSTVCTIGPIHYLLHKSHLQKTKLISQNHLSLVFHDFYRLLPNTVTWCGYTVQACESPFKQKLTFFLKVGEGGDGQKKKRKSIQCSFSHGLSSNSSTLMTFAGIEGSGCSSTSDPNHFARPGGGLLPCLCELFVRWGPWFCKWGPGMLGCTVMRFKKKKKNL